GIRHGRRTHHEMPPECGPESRKVAVVPLHRSVGDELVEEPRKELTDDLHALAEQDVRMSVLGHSTATRRSLGQNVAFDDGDDTKVVGEHTGGEEAAHARAEDDCSVTTF